MGDVRSGPQYGVLARFRSAVIQHEGAVRSDGDAKPLEKFADGFAAPERMIDVNAIQTFGFVQPFRKIHSTPSIYVAFVRDELV